MKNSEEGKAALEYLVRLTREGVVPTRVEIEEKGKGTTQMFSAGRLGMIMAHAFLLPTLDEIKDFPWDAAFLPRSEGKERMNYFAALAATAAAATLRP